MQTTRGRPFQYEAREVVAFCIRLFLVPVLATALLGSAKGQGVRAPLNSEESVKVEIMRLQDEEDRALLRGDVPLLDRLWADSLLYPNDNGEVLTKSQRLAEVRSQVHSFALFRHEDVRVHLYNGNTAVVTGYSTTLKKYKGVVSRGPRRFSAVWIKMDDHWQMVAHQRTDMSRQ